MFVEKWQPHSFQSFNAKVETGDGIQVSERPSSIKLNVNCFRLVFENPFFHYHYDLEGEAAATASRNPQEERRLLETVWRELEGKLSVFCLRVPGHIFSPSEVEGFKISKRIGSKEFSMTVSFHEKLTSASGVASVVAQHIAKQLASPARKVGRRMYKEQVVVEPGKSSMNTMHSLSVLHSYGLQGPLLMLDLMNRPVHEKTIIDLLRSVMPGVDVFQHGLDREMQTEWLQCCISSTVVTAYNNRIYKIKKVHFDMTPDSLFTLNRKGDADVKISLQKYVELFYNCSVKFKSQPVLEAFPDKPSERVFLLPEFCHLIGTDEESNQKRLMETLKRLKASPQERFDAVLQAVAKDLKDDICAKWGCKLDKKPLTVEGHCLASEKWHVSFEEDQRFQVDEEGNFTRWLRHGPLGPSQVCPLDKHGGCKAIEPYMSTQDTHIQDLVQALNRLSLAIEGSNSRQDSDQWEVVSEAEGPANSPSMSFEEQISRIEYNDYQSFAELIPPCPPHLLRLCERLVEGQYTTEYRARRAWEAGFWAYLAIRGKVRVPRASLPCDLRRSVYVVLRAPSLASPTRVSRVSDLFRLVGRVQQDNVAVFHGFASLAEAETYCRDWHSCAGSFHMAPKEEDLQHQVQAYVLMRRAAGVLVVFPDHVIDTDSIMPFCMPTEDGLVLFNIFKFRWLLPERVADWSK
eukprot:s824_g3.t1